MIQGALRAWSLWGDKDGEVIRERAVDRELSPLLYFLRTLLRYVPLFGPLFIELRPFEAVGELRMPHLKFLPLR